MTSKNTPTEIEEIEISNSEMFLCDLEKNINSENSTSPISDYTRVLKYLRKEVQKVTTQREEIEFAMLFKEKLAEFSKRYNLPEDHFSIDISGSQFLVKEYGGEHLISTTHFENGAYFSHPHADHQMELKAEQIPKIRIGQYVRFGRNASVNAGGDITIGIGVWLSPGSQLLRQNHDPYGRPSVGARTVAMTTLPAITLSDYAWVGREAMVGWAADYIGKASIIATRTFVNTWVGDYSVVGDRGKVLQYMPFKAYLLEHKKLSLKEILMIDDWVSVDEEWLRYYRNEVEGNIIGHMLHETIQLNNKDGVLIINPPDANGLADFTKQKLDIISTERNICPSVLQWCLNNDCYNVRFRGDFNLFSLPFLTGGSAHYRRKTGYSLIICHLSTKEINDKLMNEIMRVAAPDAKIILQQEAYKLICESLTSECLYGEFVFNREIFYGEKSYVMLEKKG